jgi:hypothetical protein
MKIYTKSRAFFGELTRGLDRYECDPMSDSLHVKGEPGVRLRLRKDKEPPFHSTLLFMVASGMHEIFANLAGLRYKLEQERDGYRTYVVMNVCSNYREFIETALEALEILDECVMLKRMSVSLDATSSSPNHSFTEE